MSIAPFVACQGSWQGRSILRDPEYGIDEECATTATITAVLKDRFVRLDASWSYRGEPQEGSLLIAHDPGTDVCHVYWMDTWHTGHSVMACEGIIVDARLTVRGSYPVPGSADWGWRIDVACEATSPLVVTMYNISPAGEEELAVEATYERR